MKQSLQFINCFLGCAFALAEPLGAKVYGIFQHGRRRLIQDCVQRSLAHFNSGNPLRPGAKVCQVNVRNGQRDGLATGKFRIDFNFRARDHQVVDLKLPLRLGRACWGRRIWRRGIWRSGGTADIIVPGSFRSLSDYCPSIRPPA